MNRSFFRSAASAWLSAGRIVTPWSVAADVVTAGRRRDGGKSCSRGGTFVVRCSLFVVGVDRGASFVVRCSSFVVERERTHDQPGTTNNEPRTFSVTR